MENMEILGKDNASDLYIFINRGTKRYKVCFSRELLDDEVGDDSSLDIRKGWIQKHATEISNACTAKIKGGVLRPPFDRIIVKEVD